MLDPISYTIEVPCSQQKAFEVFVNDFGKWWPLAKRSTSMMTGNLAKSVHFDPKVGGKIIETGHDDTQHLWGTVKTYNPYDDFSMHFHMGLPASNPSGLVTVVFTALANTLTKVVLTHSDWEAYGDMAEMMHNGYGGSWGMLFEGAYKDACEK